MSTGFKHSTDLTWIAQARKGGPRPSFRRRLLRSGSVWPIQGNRARSPAVRPTFESYGDPDARRHAATPDDGLAAPLFRFPWTSAGEIGRATSELQSQSNLVCRLLLE